MTARRPGGWLVTAAVAAAAVVVTRWLFLSRALFSWDSANFALAMARIDIAAHRPHPPGYLGYVLAGRAINRLVGDPNLSLVLWNIAVTALAAAVLVRWAWESAEGDRRQASLTLGVVAILVTSPLLWFYGEIAEIYPSELVVVLLVAFAAWRAIRGQTASIYWCAVGLAAAAVFKVSAAVLIFPLALYAWTRVPAPTKRRSALLLAVLGIVVAAGFLALQPDLLTVVWRQFVVATSGSRLIGGQTSVLRALNINVRDTFTAAASALGVVNGAAFLVWLAIDRRLPAGLDRRTAGLWLGPWLLLVLAVHIGRRGYILPLLPLAALVMGGFYARQRRGVTIAIVTLQIVVNAAQFAWLVPPPRAMVGGSALYRDKTLIERVLSDLDAITFPTAFTIASSDRRASALTALVAATCPSGDPIIVAEADWRRVLWYFPGATAVNTSGHDVLFSGMHTDAAPIPASGLTLTARCPVIWLTGDDGAPGTFTPAGARVVTDVGAVTGAATLVITPRTIEAR